jgi:hypothetical protein
LVSFLAYYLFSSNILFFVCSGYLRSHGLKYQTVLLPNGLFTGVFGLSISHNDLGVLNMSRLTRYLEDILFPDYAMPGGLSTLW